MFSRLKLHNEIILITELSQVVKILSEFWNMDVCCHCFLLSSLTTISAPICLSDSIFIPTNVPFISRFMTEIIIFNTVICHGFYDFICLSTLWGSSIIMSGVFGEWRLKYAKCEHNIKKKLDSESFSTREDFLITLMMHTFFNKKNYSIKIPKLTK